MNLMTKHRIKNTKYSLIIRLSFHVQFLTEFWSKKNRTKDTKISLQFVKTKGARLFKQKGNKHNDFIKR